MKVIIIGAGISGLAAAHTLRKNGSEVIILEEKDIAGGRIAGAWKEGYTMDLGAQLFSKYNDTTFQLCREVGLEDDIVLYPLECVFFKDNRLYPLLATMNPGILWQYKGDLSKSAHTLLAFSMKSKIDLLRILFKVIQRRRDLHPIHFDNALDLDTESLEDFCLNHGWDSELLEYVFQPLSACTTFGNSDQVSALGIGTLARRLYENCRESVRLSTPVRQIVIENGEVKGVEAESGFMDADAVICTTTATTALKLMPNLPDTLRIPLETVRYKSCCHVMFALKKRVFPDNWYVVLLPRSAGTSMAGLTDDSTKSSSYVPEGGGIIHCFTYEQYAEELNEKPDKEIFSHLIKEIQRIVPSMPDKPFFSEVYRWKEAMCVAPPGMLTTVNRMKKENYRDVRGLFLAGDYMYMPSMEGSARSGIDAAKAVLAG
jgi:oxygen-dependent protoporphyrinogen oxidase